MSRNVEAIRKRMQALVDEIAQSYDLSQFTLDGFARWLEQRRGRRIIFVPRPMPLDLFGAWLADAGCDYIFYEANTLPVHQAHIQLHGMAYMLCGHSPAKIDSRQVEALLHDKDADISTCESLLVRSTHPDETELEAEILALLIQERLLRNTNLRKLSEVISSDQDIVTYIQALELI